MKIIQPTSSTFLATLVTVAIGCFFCPARVSGVQVAPEIQTAPQADAAVERITLTKNEKTVTVMIGNKIFTQLHHSEFAKPILYPLYGPGQIGMTRNFPMKDDVQGEAHDHPHHKSLWFSHEINGFDFWTERGGNVVVTSVEIDDEQNAITTQSEWIPKSKPSSKNTEAAQAIFQDTTQYRFGVTPSSRWIDATYQIQATVGDVVFKDTKEGTFGLRTHPDLRLTANPKHGVEEVFGSAINSNGVSGKKLWGKPAKWVMYRGPIDGTPMSIAIFDHPKNLRHPTTWHARDYGLVAANPFGMHDFLKKPKGAGEYTIQQGDSLKLRYRVVFIAGIATAEEAETKWAEFANDGMPKK
jgi:hypothetical protein